jgi:hypothetical protein
MQSIMKDRESSKKIHRLKVDAQFPFKIIGISSHENDYRLIWAVNANLHTRFVKIENFRIPDAKGIENEFSRYYFEDEDRYIACYIISNRCDNGYMVPEYRTVDYFMFLKGETGTGFTSETIRRLKRIEIISTAFLIDNKTIRSIKRLNHLDG